MNTKFWKLFGEITSHVVGKRLKKGTDRMNNLHVVLALICTLSMTTFATVIRKSQKLPGRIPLHSKVIFHYNGQSVTFHSKMRCRLHDRENFSYRHVILQMPTNVFYECGTKLIVNSKHIVYLDTTNKTEGAWNYVIEKEKIIPNTFIPTF